MSSMNNAQLQTVRRLLAPEEQLLWYASTRSSFVVPFFALVIASIVMAYFVDVPPLPVLKTVGSIIPGILGVISVLVADKLVPIVVCTSKRLLVCNWKGQIKSECKASEVQFKRKRFGNVEIRFPQYISHKPIPPLLLNPPSGHDAHITSALKQLGSAEIR